MAHQHRISWKHLWLAVLIYTILSLAFTYPLVLRMSTAVLGWPGDNLEYVWKMWWFEHAIVDARTSPLFAPQVYYPHGLDMALAEMTPANTVLGIPLTAAFGPVFSYNVMILLSFVLSGLGMYLLTSEYTTYPIAALASGLAFAFCPYRIAHSPGHLPLMGTQWIPLLFWAVERWRRSARWHWAGLAGLFFSLAALSSWYYAVFVALALAVFVLLRLRPWRQYLWQMATVWSVLAFLAVCGTLVVPFASIYLETLGRGSAEHPYQWVLAGSASPTDFFVPNLLHPLWGSTLQSLFESQSRFWVERSIYLGWIGLSLAVVAIVARRRDSAVWAYVAVAVLAIVMALGPTLRWMGETVTVLLPALLRSLADKVGLWPILVDRLGAEDGRLTVPLPVQVLRLVAPSTKPIRVWARMGLLASFAVAALTGIGLDHLCTVAASRWSWAKGGRIGWIAVALILLDLAAIPALWPIDHPYITPTESRAVDRWLQEQDKGVLIEFPALHSTSSLYYSIAHGMPIVTGYGTFIPQHFREKRAILDAFPSEDSVAVLRDWQVRYLLFNSTQYGTAWPEFLARLNETQDLELAHVAQGVYVFVME